MQGHENSHKTKNGMEEDLSDQERKLTRTRKERRLETLNQEEFQMPE